MKKSFLIAVLLIVGTIFLVQASIPPKAEAGIVRKILFYIPDRVFDILDIVRLRVRVGPGISVGVRATKPVSAFIGTHLTVWAGLHGPRGRLWLPLPFGVEARSGAQASVVDLAKSGCYYGPLEIGFETQLFLLGPNVGVAPFEVIDFVAGIFFIDLQNDDFGISRKEKEETLESEIITNTEGEPGTEEGTGTGEIIELE
jgi:hypothetical protein